MNRARLAVVLGSGLSSLGEIIESERTCPYTEVRGLASPTVHGHPGSFLLSRLGGRPVLICSGRYHVYEGYDIEQAGGVVTIAASLGCRAILLTQAAGGLHRDLPIGSWLIPRDVVFMPVRGIGMVRSRPGVQQEVTAARGRFLIDGHFRREIEEASRRAGVKPYAGTLHWTPGPSYESAAEARAARLLGADAANMSCLPELHAARRAGLAAACLSWVSNHTANCSVGGTDHGTVVSAGAKAVRSLERIIAELARRAG